MLLKMIITQFMGIAIFGCGALLLFSGSIPESYFQTPWVREIIPLPLFESAHFLGSLVGLGLLFLGRSIQQRIYAGYLLTVALLFAGIIFSILRGIYFVQPLFLITILCGLLFFREDFYRKSNLTEDLFSRSWIIAILLVLICFFWLGMFNYRHIEYSHTLWWKFEFSNDASRFLRLSVAVVIFALSIALRMLLKPFHPEFLIPSTSEMDDVRNIVKASSRSSGSFAFLPDKRFLFSNNRQAFVMYGISGQSWIVLGDPVGPIAEWEPLIWKFRELCDQYNVLPAFVEIGKSALSIYLNMGFTLLKMGEEAIISLEQFTLENHNFKKFRYLLRKANKQQCFFEVVHPPHSTDLICQLKQVSDHWLKSKKGHEKRFSLGFFDAEYLQNFQLGIVRSQGEIVAFTNIWVSFQKQECEADIMRYNSEKAPKFIMEYLFIKTIMWAKEQEIKRFSLGSVLLSGFKDRHFSSLWQKTGLLIFHNAESIYRFQGLKAFKEKFHPVWEDRYVACSSGSSAVKNLFDMTYLVSGNKPL